MNILYTGLIAESPIALYMRIALGIKGIEDVVGIIIVVVRVLSFHF